MNEVILAVLFSALVVVGVLAFAWWICGRGYAD